ncbi:putative regulator of nucleoside diphosphate kinase [Pseudoalteromonas translucida]|uniref:Regulator of nucleoside diphosphate kinase n=1 Tax=Pseudoalteromonas translucida (strain TAC 125) TaxID=326442 RepID=Q3IDT1_PSET1|nr:putative regulator of nucleoside diphosphate kinase [Pseudoalteromonas translucida]
MQLSLCRIILRVSFIYINIIKDIELNKRPEIIISSLDADRLYDLIESLPANSFAGEKELEAELGRATIVDPKDVPATIVTMNSTVNFVVESSKEEFNLTLVYPKDLDASGQKISILAPIGGALLGLSQGDEIEWPKPGGGLIKVKIKEVTYQPERVGELHR